MIQFMFAVYDSKVRAYLQPFFVPLPAVALRTFAQAANDEKGPIGAHPEDYTLFELGTFDDERGVFELQKQSINHGPAAQFTMRSS